MSIRRIKACLLTAVCIGLVGLAATPASAQDAKVAIGYSGWTGFAPLTLAKEAGIFKKNGLDVSLKKIPQASRHLAIAVLAEVALFAGSGRLLARIGPANMLIAGAALSVLRWVLMAFDPPGALLVPLQVLHAVTYGGSHIGAIYFIAQAVPPLHDKRQKQRRRAVGGADRFDDGRRHAGPCAEGFVPGFQERRGLERGGAAVAGERGPVRQCVGPARQAADGVGGGAHDPAAARSMTPPRWAGSRRKSMGRRAARCFVTHDERRSADCIAAFAQ